MIAVSNLMQVCGLRGQKLENTLHIGQQLLHTTQHYSPYDVSDLVCSNLALMLYVVRATSL